MDPGSPTPSNDVAAMAERLDGLFGRWAFEVDAGQFEEREALEQVAAALRDRGDDRWREVNLMHVWMSHPGNWNEDGARATWNAAWRHETERRTCVELIRDCSCGGMRDVVAESPTGLGHASKRGPWLNQGIAVARYRCTACGSASYVGWVPPTWIDAIAREAARIKGELDQYSAVDAQRRRQR